MIHNRGPAGRLIRAYHVTTQAGFETFRIAKGDIGIHFGTREQAADRLTWKILHGESIAAAATIPVLLDIRNPLRMEDVNRWVPSRIAEELYNAEVLGAADLHRARRQASLRKLLRDKGYDGIVYKNRGEGEGLSHAAFQDIQIRRRMALQPYNSPEWLALQQQLLATGRQLAAIRERAEDSYIVFDPAQVTMALSADNETGASSHDAGAFGLAA